MKEESINLYFKSGGSDKVYFAELKQQAPGWMVNFAYGRRGSALNTGSKTPAPIGYDDAKRTYDKLVQSKTAKGYTEDVSGKAFLGAIGLSGEDTGVRPQLLNPIEDTEVIKYLTDDKWLLQEKFDGRRRLLFCEGSKSFAANRKGLKVDISDAVLAVIQNYPEGTILDGEDLGDKVVLFDILNIKKGYLDRFLELSSLWIPSGGVLELAETAYNEEGKRQALAELKYNKAEGVVFKKTTGLYAPGRPNSGGDQVKFKFVETASCIVISTHQTKRSIEVGVMDGPKVIPVGNVTVYPNQQIPHIGSIQEIKYLYFFPGGSLYQPVLIGQRDDLLHEDCTLSKLKTKPTKEEEEE